LASLAHALERETHKTRVGRREFAVRSELAAELVVGGAFSVLRAHLVERPREPLAGLASELIQFIVALYRGKDDESQAGRLPVRTTYRTTRVLSVIAASPRLSNREIADEAGLSDEGQTSKLLRRLEQRGLVENVGPGQAYGGANAWLLTGYGEHVLDATRHSLVPGAGAVMGSRVRGAT
jgi:hypothetical protein